MLIEINALDTVFFRDGRPFSLGEDSWADGIFPPYPSTLYGALRSLYFADHVDELKKTNTEDDPTKGLKINGIYLKIGNDFYFPLPLDCVKDKDGNKEKEVFVLPLSKKGDFIANFNFDYYLTSNKKIKNLSQAFFTTLDLKDYLRGEREIPYIELNDYLANEPKIGIARSKETLTSEDHKLYRVGMKRLANDKGEFLSIVVDFDGLDIPKEGILKLGAEGKSAKYWVVGDNLSVNPPEFKLDDKFFKFVLSTPAIFDNGWIPSWIDKKSFEGNVNGINIKLITAAIGKPLIIGGFDMKERKPKPAYKAVPAGSVYYFEILNGEIETVIEFFHKKSISDKYQNEGYGISFVGKFNL